MKPSDLMNPQGSPQSTATQDAALSQGQILRSKRIAYLTLPLLIMATVVEFVILATGWKYQQVVCLPQGMGVTFFGIGPIGATILAVELLKLPLAIWTASRQGWQKGLMLMVGLPLICLLTFQLVKDMAVYEMGVAMLPASQMLEKATAEDIKITQLNGELAAIEGKRTERERKLADLATRQTKAKAELEESLKRNDAARQDAISLTDYQKKELSEAEARQATIIQQAATDTEQLTRAIGDLRVRREAEFARSAKASADWETRKAAYDAAFAKWHSEEARIDNVYQTSMAKYANEKAAYAKDKAAYAAANFLKRQLLLTPIEPGVPPVREANKFPKPAELDNRPSALIAEIDVQIKAKETELLAANNKRRERISQVDADARRLREEFDHRSTTKREETDRKREELSVALAALAKEQQAERGLIDREFETVLQKVDSIRGELDSCHKKAQGYYEAREEAIRKTQVHRIATTVEIVRGLLMGERPVSIKVTAKERGDLLTDQISMVRIWVYPVLAFIVAFLPTLMVEIGFSTVFQPEQQRPAYRLGWFGRRLHWLYTRAGRQKILRAERLAREASVEIVARDKALAAAQATSERALAEKEAETRAACAAVTAAEAKHQEQLKQKEDEWVAKLAGLAGLLNRAEAEKDALRDFQKSEIERQVQLRQNAWSDRLAHMRQDLETQRAAGEEERSALVRDHHKEMLELSEDCKTQVLQARRQAADAEMATVTATAKLAHDLRDATTARDAAQAQLQQQAESFALKLAQTKEDATRETEKAARLEKQRSEQQQSELAKTLRQRDEDLEHRLQQREQELCAGFSARLAEEQTRLEEDARRRVAELERQTEARTRELEARWKQEAQQREEAAQIRLKQRELELTTRAAIRETELQNQSAADLLVRQEEWENQAESRIRAAETRLGHEAQQKEELFQIRLRQREQQLQSQFDARQAELRTQWDQELREREQAYERSTEASTRATEAMRDELDALRAASTAERADLVQEHHKKLLELSEDSKAQLMKVRRQGTEAEATAAATTAKLANDLKEAASARDAAQAQLQQQADSFALKLAQTLEDAARETEKAARLEKQRSEQQQSEFAKTLRQRDEDQEHRSKQREQELGVGFEALLAEEQTRLEVDARRRVAELERQMEARTRELEARWKQEVQQREEAAAVRLKQREQQLQAQAEARLTEIQSQSEQGLRRRDAEFERQLEAQLREADTRSKQELQQRELTFQAKLKQREQELTTRAAARETELQNQWASDLRVRQEDWERQAESRTRATETRLGYEAQQKEELFQSNLRQRDQQWQAKIDAFRGELQVQTEQEFRRREAKSADDRQRALRELEAKLRREMQQQEESVLAQSRQREQDLVARLAAQAEAHQAAAQEREKKLELLSTTIEPLRTQLARAEKERDEARQTASEGARQVRDLEEKLIEASVLLGGWKNGKNGSASRYQPTSPLAMVGRTNGHLEQD